MGFRGEALASIAAIANVEMVSKTANQEIGYKVVVEGGDILEKEEAGCRTGTTITVRNLFFNTPVRYKFLKKDYTESGYIEDVITRIALVHPEIAIKLINTGKTIIQTNGNGELKSVIYSIYGKNVAEGVLQVKYEYEDIKVEGVIGKPEIARSNRSNQLFFVNKRYIKDKTLSAATEQAYKGMIPIGKFGFVVLNVEMNPAKVDVNVHPAKLEVRFEEESKIFQAIYHAIKDSLLKGDLVADTSKEGEVNQNSNGLFKQRYTNNNEIKEYIEKESEIKTNAKENIAKALNMDTGKPINTADILEKLRKLQQNIKQTVEENPKIKLNDSYIKMSEKINNPESQEEIKEENAENQSTNSQENHETITVNTTPVDMNENSNDNSENNNENQEKNTENKEINNENEVQNNQNETSQEKAEETTNHEDNNENNKENNEENANETNNLNQVSEINEKEFEEKKDKLEKLQDNSYQEPVDFDEMYQKLFKTKPIKNSSNEENKEENRINAIDIVKNNTSLFENIEEYKKVPYKFIGIVFKTYIILEMNKEMYILDQHAAHERIMYEKVKKNYYSDKTKDSQMLLLPDIITLTHKEMDIAKENMAMFEKAGFTLEEFGENTIKLTGVPTVCIDLDTKDLFLETLDEINTVARTAKQEKEERFIATVACKAAVKAHMALTPEEVDSLMDKLLELPNPFTCPHGRPTVIKMTQYDIEKKFARKQ